VVAYSVAAASHPAAVAAASTAPTAAPHYALVEQPSIQILVVASGQTPATVASSVHPSGSVPDTGQQTRRRVPVSAVVRTVSSDQLIAWPIAPYPRFP